ncbi:MAG: ABC transporter permease subunit [Tepidisphaeraceae bacterium]
MKLSGISPFGPIFGKELRTASRRKRNYLLRVVYLGLLLLCLLLAYTVTSERSYYTGVSARQQQQEQLGWFFFMFFSVFSVFAMGLIGAVVTSTAINAEREHKTLHVLLMTPLTSWQIVSGKLFSRMLTALTLIGLSLPVLALVRLLGGVELKHMFAVVALCTVTAMTSGAIGLVLSIMLRRAYAVILVSYLLMGLIYLFIPLMTFAFVAASNTTRLSMRWLEQALAACNPFWCTIMLASGQGRLVNVDWGTCIIVHLVFTAVLLVAAAVLLRRLGRKEGASAGPMPDAQGFPVTDALMENGARSIPIPVRLGRTVSDRPVLWRELRRPLMSKRWHRMVAGVGCLALLVISYLAAGVNNGLDDEELQIGYGICFHMVMMLLACVLAATAIAQEKESDTWTVLLASPLSGMAIVWGKALGALRRLMWPMIAIAGHFMLFTVGGVITPAAAMTALVVIAGFNVIWIATGVYFSLRCKKVTVAVILNLSLPVLLYGVLSLLLVVTDEMLNIRGDDLVDQVTWWLPFYYLGSALDAGQWGNRPRMPGSGYEQVSQSEFFLTAAAVAALHLGVAVAVLSWTAARFNRVVGRAPQREPIGSGFPVMPSSGPSWASGSAS